MQHAEQIAVTERLLAHIAAGTTTRSDAVYEQPVAEYTSDAFARRERERLFARLPLCVGLSCRLPERSSYFRHDLSGSPLLLTRDDDGRFNAFLNVCRHRGAALGERDPEAGAPACHSAQRISCPYHAWTYDLRGELVARPDEQSFAALPRSTLGLKRLPAVERDGLLWVGLGGAVGMEALCALDPLGAELTSFEFAGYHLHARQVLRRRMNWKLVVDTFLESYHFNTLHKNSIAPIFHDNLATFDAFGPHFRLVSPRRTIGALQAQAASEWNLLPHSVVLYTLHPNTVLVWQLDHVELWTVFPGETPDEAVLQLEFYTPEAATTPGAHEHWRRNIELVLRVVETEDFPVGEQIQRGFHSDAQSHIVFGTNEPALAHYHRSITAACA